MRRLGRTVDRISNVAGYFSGWLVLVMMLLVGFEVFTRYVLQQPLRIADELSAYMLVTLSYLGAAYTWKERGHVRVTFVVNRLPPRVASWLRLVTLVFAFLFLVGLCQASYGFLTLSFKLHMVSASWLRVPLQWPQITVPVGFAILALLLILEIARTIMKIRAGINIEETIR